MTTPTPTPTPQTIKKITLKKVDGKPGEVWYPLQISTTPLPQPTPSQHLLSPTHLSLNHRDLFLRQHLYPSPSFTTPLFSDALCLLLSPTPPHPPLSPPQRFLLNPGTGWASDPRAPERPYAILGGTELTPLGVGQELVAVEKEECVPCPEHLSDAEAAALPLTGLTAWRAVVRKSGAWREGGKVLVTGVGGGVAGMVVRFAVAGGLRVWVTSGTVEKVERAREMGAVGGWCYREVGWERRVVAEVGGGGLDAVIDGAGGEAGRWMARVLKPGGVFVSYGMTMAPQITVPMAAVLKNIEVRGSTMGSRREFREMVEFVREKGIRPVVSEVVGGGFENLEGLERLFGIMKEGKQFGKLVFAMGEVEEGEVGGGSKL